MSHFLDRLDKNLLISLFKFFFDAFCETNRRILSSTTTLSTLSLNTNLFIIEWSHDSRLSTSSCSSNRNSCTRSAAVCVFWVQDQKGTSFFLPDNSFKISPQFEFQVVVAGNPRWKGMPGNWR